MTNKEKRVFFNWLKQKGVLEKYKRNRFNFLHTNKHFEWEQYYKYSYMPMRNAIDFAFSWSESREGYSFWLELDLEWEELILDINKSHIFS
jgi:hypothetical protein